MLLVTRKTSLAKFVYEVLRDMARPITSSFFTRQITPYEMRDNLKLVKPVYNTMQYGFRYIMYQGAMIWNSLPVEVKEVAKFTDLLRLYSSLESYNCGSCIVCQQDNL